MENLTPKRASDLLALGLCSGLVHRIVDNALDSTLIQATIGEGLNMVGSGASQLVSCVLMARRVGLARWAERRNTDLDPGWHTTWHTEPRQQPWSWPIEAICFEGEIIAFSVDTRDPIPLTHDIRTVAVAFPMDEGGCEIYLQTVPPQQRNGLTRLQLSERIGLT